jgi:TRAP-type mannitol/chloroaromatic compound transport system permease small subunit
LVWVGAEFFYRSALIREVTTSDWAPPIYPVKLFIPLGAFLITLQGLAKFIRDFNIATKGEELQ